MSDASEAKDNSETGCLIIFLVAMCLFLGPCQHDHDDVDHKIDHIEKRLDKLEQR